MPHRLRNTCKYLVENVAVGGESGEYPDESAAGNGNDGSIVDYRLTNPRPGPTVTSMLVGARLRRLRETRGISRAAAGAVIGVSQAKLGRLELGRTAIDLDDLTKLLTLYEVDGFELQTLLALAGQGDTPAWWQAYREVVPPWFEAYLNLEPLAIRIRSYDVDYIPGLLQTPDYARAVIRHGHPDADDRAIECRVRMRLHRQQILHRSTPPQVWVVIDETALRAGFGGRETMRAQLRHLIEIAISRRHVTVQVLPFTRGGHSAAGEPLALLRLPEPTLPDVVYLERLTGAEYPARRSDVLHYQQLLDHLVVQAHSPPVSIDMLRDAYEHL
ncbi:helix-turn-helix domain-containing protein [Actinomadura sp. 9N215]|uniref:helix-turn-helix domain-containing protein n=1 Tax=Actinomadura sp. 9N215 TaxID=3375150 RepID=UPI00379C5B34